MTPTELAARDHPLMQVTRMQWIGWPAWRGTTGRIACNRQITTANKRDIKHLVVELRSDLTNTLFQHYESGMVPSLREKPAF
jgi:hypothetical protein